MSAYTVFSQGEEEALTPLVLSGDFYDYEIHSHINNLVITTLDQDTTIQGITLFNSEESIHIIPTENYRINIKPNDEKDLIYLYVEDRAKGNSTAHKGGGEEDDEIIIYPNPVKTDLYIETNETIHSYQIKDMYNVVQLQGNELTNNSINVDQLQTGLYYIILETSTKIIIKSIIKN